MDARQPHCYFRGVFSEKPASSQNCSELSDLLRFVFLEGMSVARLKAQAAERDKKTQKEVLSITKQSKKTPHVASAATTHDTGFKRVGASVGPGGSHHNISASGAPSSPSKSSPKPSSSKSSPKPSFFKSSPKPASSPASGLANFCAGCGTRAGAGAFCSSCGTKL